MTNISPEIASSWALVASLALCILIGSVLVSGSFYRLMRWAKLTGVALTGLVIFAVLGIILLTTPKWTQIALKFSGFEATISKLEQENRSIRTQLAAAEADRDLSDYFTTAKIWKQAQPNQFESAVKAVLASTKPESSPDQKAQEIVETLRAAGIEPFVRTNQLPADPSKYNDLLLGGVTASGWRQLEDQGIVPPNTPN